MSDLTAFTTDQLLVELVRRRNGEQAAEPIEHWCDDCAHFRYSKNESDTRNNCTRDHAMQFREPQDSPYEAFGFYRRVCADRTARPEPPPAPRARPAIVRGGR